MTRAAAAWVLALLAALAGSVDPARACSCVPLDDPRRTLRESDAAFIGRVVSQRDVDRGMRTIYVFRVDEAVKGPLGETVEVESASHSAACGIEVPRGMTIGLFLSREGGRWTSSLCRQIEPARLRAAARPLPRPAGRGPIALLAGGSVGPYRTLALDARGRTLAYGGGGGTVTGHAVCPGSRRAVELVTNGVRTTLAVRDLRTFRVVRARALRRSFTYGSVACRDRAGGDVLLYADNQHENGEDLVLRARGGAPRTLWSGSAWTASVTRARAFVCAGALDGVPSVLVVGLDGDARRAASVPRWTGPLTPSRDGRFLAGVSAPGDGGAKVVLVDLRTRRVRTVRLRNHPSGGTAAWLGPRRFAVLPAFSPAELRTFSTRLRPLAVISPWRAVRSAVDGSRVVGVDRRGALLAARLPDGRPRTLRTLPSGAISALVRVPDDRRTP